MSLRPEPYRFTDTVWVWWEGGRSPSHRKSLQTLGVGAGCLQRGLCDPPRLLLSCLSQALRGMGLWGGSEEQRWWEVNAVTQQAAEAGAWVSQRALSLVRVRTWGLEAGSASWRHEIDTWGWRVGLQQLMEAVRFLGVQPPSLLVSTDPSLYLFLVRVAVGVFPVWGRRRLRSVLHLTPPSSVGQDLVAASGDLVHPDGVQDVQGDAGRDPGHLGAQAQTLKVWSTKGGEDAGPVRRHNSDTHQEEDHRHGDAVRNHQAVWAGVL